MKNNKQTDLKLDTKISIAIFFIIIILGSIASYNFSYGYKINRYSNIKEVIEYANENKQNVYLYTSPSLQFRYLAYSAYQMPPQGAFANLRVMGGWDMFTQNYYDFKKRNNLDGNFLDLLKENVYLIDGEVTWSGNKYENYKQHIIDAIKEHYGIDVEYELVEDFGRTHIFKIKKKI